MGRLEAAAYPNDPDAAVAGKGDQGPQQQAESHRDDGQPRPDELDGVHGELGYIAGIRAMARRRIQAAMYRARIDVLREQLRAARGTYWTGVAG